MTTKGKAVIFCAPSGAGKTTIVKHLLQHIPQLKFSISATTRSIRQGVEQEGRDYYFLDESTFKARLEHNDFYEWQEVYQGTFYGTLKSEVERIWAEGNHVIFDLDVIGGVNLKQILGDRALAVFVAVNDVATLENRLRVRNTETEESLQKRVAKAAKEMEYAAQFDYVLVNEDLSRAFSEALAVVNDFLAK